MPEELTPHEWGYLWLACKYQIERLSQRCLDSPTPAKRITYRAMLTSTQAVEKKVWDNYKKAIEEAAK